MKTALLAIVKNENKYLHEWCQWYKDLGIDKIYLYDNNDLDGERPETVLSDFGDFVKVVDWRGKHIKDSQRLGQTTQGLAYAHWWAHYHRQYDWVCIFDADEFLRISDKYSGLQDFLQDYSKYSDIKIQWVVYGDNEQITHQEGRVRDRFCLPSNAHKSCQHKSIVNCKKNKCPLFHAHGPIKFSNAVNIERSPVKSVWRDYKVVEHPSVWLEHYVTKSTQEYLQRKWHQPDALRNDNINQNVDLLKKRYFAYNTKTPEKEQYFNNFCK